MERFTVLCAPAILLDLGVIDTDQIIPARFLKRRRGPEYRDFLFHDWRFRPDGSSNPEFPLNQSAGARILVANADFGVGSAREAAVWALTEFGIRAVIAPGFGDVFRQNCVRNGVLPVALSKMQTTALRHRLSQSPGIEIVVDLPKQCITALAGVRIEFAIDPFDKEMLLTGLEETALTARHLPAIEAFEAHHHAANPWLREPVGCLPRSPTSISGG